MFVQIFDRLCIFLQRKCESFKSYLLEINSKAEQNWLKDKGKCVLCVLTLIHNSLKSFVFKKLLNYIIFAQTQFILCIMVNLDNLFYIRKSHMRNEINCKALYSLFSNTQPTKHAGPK